MIVTGRPKTARLNILNTMNQQKDPPIRPNSPSFLVRPNIAMSPKSTPPKNAFPSTQICICQRLLKSRPVYQNNRTVLIQI